MTERFSRRGLVSGKALILAVGFCSSWFLYKEVYELCR